MIDALFRSDYYYVQEIVEHLGSDAFAAVEGFLSAMKPAIKVMISTTAAGAALGAVGGSFFFGIGAAPGAVFGAEVGAEAGVAILTLMGLGYLIPWIGGTLEEVGACLKQGASTAWDSKGSSTHIDQAAQQFGHARAVLARAILQALIQYVLAKGMKAASEQLQGSKGGQQAAEWLRRAVADGAEWAKLIEATELKPPRDRGILWSKIGEQRATALAAERGLVSLEMLLKDNGFRTAYDNAFGAAQNATTEQIWRLLSEKYARNLQGRVIAFVDDPLLTKAIKETPVKPIKDLAIGEPALGKPQILNELMEISDVMERNPNISVVEIRDISNPNVTIKVMSRTQVLQSKAAPLN